MTCRHRWRPRFPPSRPIPDDSATIERYTLSGTGSYAEGHALHTRGIRCRAAFGGLPTRQAVNRARASPVPLSAELSATIEGVSHGVADGCRRMASEPGTPPPVEVVHCPHQPDVARLQQFAQRQTQIAVLLSDHHHSPQVALDKERSGLFVNGDVGATEAGKRLPLPPGPPVPQPQPRQARHEVQLGGPGVSELDGMRLDPPVGEDVVLGAEPLRDDVVDVEPDSSGIGAEGDDGLADREVLEVRHARLDHEPPSAAQLRRGVLEARNLLVLRDQVEDRVEHQVDERELSADTGCGEVTDRHLDVLAPGLGAQPSHHGFGAIDAGDAHAALGERERDPAGADPELQRSTLSSEVCERLNDWRHHRRVEHAGSALVIDRRSALAEETLVVALVRWHKRSLSGSTPLEVPAKTSSCYLPVTTQSTLLSSLSRRTAPAASCGHWSMVSAMATILPSCRSEQLTTLALSPVTCTHLPTCASGRSLRTTTTASPSTTSGTSSPRAAGRCRSGLPGSSGRGLGAWTAGSRRGAPSEAKRRWRMAFFATVQMVTKNESKPHQPCSRVLAVKSRKTARPQSRQNGPSMWRKRIRTIIPWCARKRPGAAGAEPHRRHSLRPGGRPAGALASHAPGCRG